MRACAPGDGVRLPPHRHPRATRTRVEGSLASRDPSTRSARADNGRGGAPALGARGCGGERCQHWRKAQTRPPPGRGCGGSPVAARRPACCSHHQARGGGGDRGAVALLHEAPVGGVAQVLGMRGGGRSSNGERAGELVRPVAGARRLARRSRRRARRRLSGVDADGRRARRLCRASAAFPVPGGCAPGRRRSAGRRRGRRPRRARPPRHAAPSGKPFAHEAASAGQRTRLLAGMQASRSILRNAVSASFSGQAFSPPSGDLPVRRRRGPDGPARRAVRQPERLRPRLGMASPAQRAPRQPRLPSANGKPEPPAARAAICARKRARTWAEGSSWRRSLLLLRRASPPARTASDSSARAGDDGDVVRLRAPWPPARCTQVGVLLERLLRRFPALA